MKRTYRHLLVASLLGLLATAALSCRGSESAVISGDIMEDVKLPLSPEELKARIANYAPVNLKYDDSVLSEPERRALVKLVEAGAIMDEIFLRQVWSGNVTLQEKLRAALRKAQSDPESKVGKNLDLIDDLNHFFRINFGPWDRLNEDEPFIGEMQKPATANYYPEDLTKEEFEAHIKANARDEEAFRGFFTTIRRKDGKLIAVPYATEYKELLERAAGLLHEAADILTRPESTEQLAEGVDYTTLAKFLRSRADAFISNDYVASDMDWMDVENNIIDVTIGPYEVYEDGLNSYKAAFEAFIAIRHPEDSRKLEGLKQYLQKLENSLPIPDEHKNPNRGSESPISVVDLVYTGGDTKAGVQTLAYNLPNDETVREAKGSKKVMLKNVSHAKFDKILMPIAKAVLDPAQMKYVEFDAYFNNVLMHEMAHGLGPGKILDPEGNETTVSRELKELYPPLEEAKADITGLYCRRVLAAEGFFPEESVTKGYVSFLPGFFRAIRFGATSAHGKANMMEFNFMREKGAIVYDEGKGVFRVDLEKMPDAVEAMTRELLMIQAKGDYEAAKAFIEKYGQVTPDIEKILEQMSDIPVDIEPIYEAEKFVRAS